MVYRVISLATVSNIVTFLVCAPLPVFRDMRLILAVKRGSVSCCLGEWVRILTSSSRK